MILCESEEITPDLIFMDETPVSCSAIGGSTKAPVSCKLGLAEHELILQALVDNQYQKGRTAKALGISRSTLWRKLREINTPI